MRAGELREGPQDAARAGAAGRVAGPCAESEPASAKTEVAAEPAPLVNILPGEEDEVLLQNRFDVAGAEAAADGAAVFVMHDAGGLVENFPAALPGHEAEVGVFQIEGREQFVEAAELQKFAAVERAGSAAAVEAREERVDGAVFAMADAQHAILPPAFGEAGFFAAFGWIAEENLAGDGEDCFVA